MHQMICLICILPRVRSDSIESVYTIQLPLRPLIMAFLKFYNAITLNLVGTDE